MRTERTRNMKDSVIHDVDADTNDSDTTTPDSLEEQAKQETKDLIHKFLTGKGLLIDDQIEIEDALCSGTVLMAFQELYKVMQGRDCTKCSAKYYDAMQTFTRAFDEELKGSLLSNLENPE